MESDVTQPAIFDKLWMWGETHKKQLLVGTVIALVVGLAIAFWFVHQGQEQIDANSALAKLVSRAASPNTPPPSADNLLKVGADYSGTDAGQRALLLGASELFAEGKYDDAHAQFQRFLQQYSDSPFAGEAALGAAACLDAQGRAQDAIDAYRGVADRYLQNWNIGPQAKLALARLLVAQGKLQDARGELMDLANPRSFPPEITGEANMRLRELFAAHPELMPAPPAAPPNGMVFGNTNRPAPSAPVVTSTNRSAAPAPFVIKVPPTNKP